MHALLLARCCRACAWLVVTAAALAQAPTTTPPAEPGAEALIAEFGQLAPEAQATVVGNLTRRLQTDRNPVLQRYSNLLRGLAAYPAQAPRQHHDPAVFAKVAPARVVLPPDSPRVLAARRTFPRLRCLDDLQQAVVYDWASGKAVRARDGLTAAETFANLAHGYPYGADQAVAQILERLDRDPYQRRLAGWFEHTYADRDGRVFAGISLYEAWCSEQQVEVPDVDAIAFAVTVLDDRSFRSPIPAGKARDRLYEQIRAATAAHRKYRTLRQAAAAAFVAHAPVFEPNQRALLDRFHYLWPQHDWDLEALAQALQPTPDRDRFLELVDGSFGSSPRAVELRLGAVQELDDLARFLRELCAFELQRQKGG